MEWDKSSPSLYILEGRADNSQEICTTGGGNKGQGENGAWERGGQLVYAGGSGKPLRQAGVRAGMM